MENVDQVVMTLKRLLRANGNTYQDVAEALGLSEASVKRMFSTRNFTLYRLQAICQQLNMSFTDLVMASENARSRIKQLTEIQEKELVSDPKLLLVALAVLHFWSFEEIISYYSIDQHECINCLARLDRLKLIELLPGNRIKLMVDHDFSWLPKGPIERFFGAQVQQEFLNAGFDEPGDLKIYSHALLAPESIARIRRKLRALVTEVAEQQRTDATMPVRERNNCGILIAMRSWEFSAFSALRRK